MTLRTLSLVGILALVQLSCAKGEAKSDKKVEKAQKAEAMAERSGTYAPARIVYIQTDTLVKQYDYYKELSKDFEGQARKVERELRTLENAFQENLKILQEQQSKLSPQQLEAAQMDLQANQQQAMQRSEQLSMGLRQEEARMMEEVMKRLRVVLDSVREELDVDYILSKAPGSNVASATPDLDVTELVLERLNAAYAEENKPKEKAK